MLPYKEITQVWNVFTKGILIIVIRYLVYYIKFVIVSDHQLLFLIMNDCIHV